MTTPSKNSPINIKPSCQKAIAFQIGRLALARLAQLGRHVLTKPTCMRSLGKSVLIFLRPTGHSFALSRDKWTDTTIGLTNATQDKTATQVRHPAAPTPGYWDPSLAL